MHVWPVLEANWWLPSSGTRQILFAFVCRLLFAGFDQFGGFGDGIFATLPAPDYTPPTSQAVGGVQRFLGGPEKPIKLFRGVLLGSTSAYFDSCLKC